MNQAEKQTENRQKNIIIPWIKRITALLTLMVWATVLYKIFQSGGTFQDQAPQCIVSTMLIFGILTGVYKGLEFWEKS